MATESLFCSRTFSRLALQSAAWSALVFSQISLLATIQAAPKAGRFFTPVEVVEPRTPISFAGSFSVGVSIDSSIPFSQPFKKTVAASSNAFRFQVPTSTRIDVAYGFSKNFELGLGLGYFAYQSRYQTNANQIETASFKSAPLSELMARYYMNFEQGIAGVFEGGIGYGRGKVEVSSTDTGAIPTQEENVNSVLGHAALGLALGWAEGYSVQFLAGYSLITLGSKTYTNAEVTQSGSLSGIYIKGGLRYQF
jgi:opacity protein-like surface antigen